MIDFSFTGTLPPTKGKLLISDPFLNDDYFRRSVIYLCEHNEEGSFGFVLNNFIDIKLSEMNPIFPKVSTRISIGGPVEVKNLYFIHTLGEKIENSILVHDNIYIGGDFEQLTKLVEEDQTLEDKIRFFIGYAGWSYEQLQEEVQSHSWIVVNLKTESDLFNTENDDIWKNYLEKLGGKFKVMSKSPINPSDN
ncbi:MAG: YqgE/AlgH family protein [Flavobacteriia bacterium]|nr:YqgE/AlgH family protein [Flavobacteriia bacterium]